MTLEQNQRRLLEVHAQLDNERKGLQAMLHGILDQLQPADEPDALAGYAKVRQVLTEARLGIAVDLLEGQVRRQVAAEASTDGPLQDRLTEKVTELQDIHGDSVVADTLTLNAHRQILEAEVTQRLEQQAIVPSSRS